MRKNVRTASPPVAIPVDAAPNGHDDTAKLSTINATVLAALKAAMATDGVEPEGPGYPGGVLVVKEDQWRQAYYDIDRGEKQDTLKKRFSRARTELEKGGFVSKRGQWFWAETAGHLPVSREGNLSRYLSR